MEADRSGSISKIQKRAWNVELAAGSAHNRHEIGAGGRRPDVVVWLGSKRLELFQEIAVADKREGNGPVFAGPPILGEEAERSASFYGFGKGVSSG
jgi:hypothetical protein